MSPGNAFAVLLLVLVCVIDGSTIVVLTWFESRLRGVLSVQEMLALLIRVWLRTLEETSATRVWKLITTL